MTVMVDNRDVVILSIQAEFAEAILEGEKSFEFRKTIGERDPALILLFVRERGAIVGAFLTGRVHRGTPDQLWSETHGAGTTKERFDAYFEGQQRGIAIGVRRFERFQEAIDMSMLTTLGFQLPPEFNIVYPRAELLEVVRPRSLLLRELERHGPRTGLDTFSAVELADFQVSDESRFLSVVTAEIGKWYDDIDIGFAAAIVESARLGRDPFGLLTKRKRIHVFTSGGRRVGFSVATEKRGGSVKFGPTVLEPDYRGQGLAILARRQLEKAYRAIGFRKAYSTIPDTHPEALSYLLKSGYVVEAHLRAQYTPEHGEFVIAKRLGVGARAQSPERREGADATEPISVGIEPPPPSDLSEFIRTHMSPFYDELDAEFRDAIIRPSRSVAYNTKPRLSVFARNGKRVSGCCVLIPKRGKALKMAPIAVVDEENLMTPFIESLLAIAAKEFAPRKFYTLVPLAQPLLCKVFEEAGFTPEGLLTEPYKPNVHMITFSKFTRKDGLG